MMADLSCFSRHVRLSACALVLALALGGYARAQDIKPAAEASTAPKSAPDVKTAKRHPWWISGELHLSVLSNLVAKSTINFTFGYAARAGYRWTDDWGAYFQIEQNLWTETEVDFSTRQGALNVGLGLEHLFFNQRMRAAFALGPSILLYNTALDEAGTTGLFFDVRPSGIRWPISKRYNLMVDPLTFTVVMPVLSGIPLVQLQYRTVVAFEWGVGR